MISDFRSGIARLLSAWVLAACCATALAQTLSTPATPATPVTENPVAQAEALARQAAEQQALGFRYEAISALERAAELVSGRADAGRLSAAILGALGQAYLRTGQNDKALPRLQQALLLARAERQPGMAAAALNDLGQIHAASGRSAEALSSFADSRRLAREAQAPLVFSAAALNAVTLVGSTQPVAAATLLEEAAVQLDTATDSREADFARIQVANSWREISQASRGLRLDATDGRTLARPYALLEQVLRSAGKRGDALAQSYAAGHLGELYADAGRDTEALELTRRAVFAAQQVRADESLYRWSWQAARLLARGGDRDAALAAYRRALASLQAVRQDLILELRAARRSWRDTVGPLFLEYAELLLRRSGTETLPQARLVEARNVVEQLKAVELEDYFQDQCVATQLAKQKDIDRIAERTAVLYPIVLPDRLELLVGLADGIRQVTLPVGAAALAADAQGLRQRLEKRSTNEFMPYARRLYAALFQPLEPLLAAHGVDTIVFIPDGPLRGLPVGALHDGRGFLIERFAFATAPGLRLVEPHPIAGQKEIRVLLTGVTDSVQSFPSLPFVEDELSGLQALFAGGRQLRNRAFSVVSFEKEMRDTAYSIVHIASHGQFDSDPKKSFLLTYEGRLDMDGLEQVMKLARFRDDPVELLTLSACRTAAGDERASLGLAGVAVKAGARSALATLWYVNDQASSLLVNDFYRRLRDGDSKAKALQEAQRSVLADARFRHPGYWAPFLLIGNWL